MTKDDKRELRRLVIHRPEMSDKYMALHCECSVQTVRRYREALKDKVKK